ncbi:MAG: ABC transporter substrate-binding protein [Burkholderiaceae bacterium]
MKKPTTPLRRAIALATLMTLAGAAAAQAPAKAPAAAPASAKPAAAAPAAGPAEKPQYGGSLSIGANFYTLSALSFDAADWTWKFNNDVGLVYEHLFVGDLDKSVRKGGKYAFRSDAFIAYDSLRGELAEKWRLLENPWRAEITLRKGVMFPARPGVMAARELTAEDVVYTYERLAKSPRKIAGYYDYVDKVEAKDKYTVLFTFKNYNAEWDYRFGWGYYGGIQPKEVVAAGAADWKHANGTGPYTLENYVQGSSITFRKNPNYWDSEKIGGQSYKIPFADTITYRTVKDESTMLTALRTGKIDILETVRWSAVPELKKNAPALQFSRALSTLNPIVFLRVDTKPFDDIRVRRALNMAINRAEIVKAYWGGNAEVLAYPMTPDWPGYYEPLSAMPDSVKETFTYDPVKAKKLLAEAGFPNGFSFKTQVSTASSNDADLLAMVAAYLAKVGVKMEIQTMEYTAYLSAMGTKTHAPGYMLWLGGSNPTVSLRKSFVTGQYWNPSMYKDPEFDKKIAEMYAEPDERVRQVKVKLMTREILEKAPFIALPTPYGYAAWWPWVKNYGGETRVGAERPGPIHARVWVDQEMKKKMGF